MLNVSYIHREIFFSFILSPPERLLMCAGKPESNYRDSMRKAMSQVRVHANLHLPAAKRTIHGLLSTHSGTYECLHQIKSLLRERGRVLVHWHPDRPDSLGRTVAAGLMQDGIYRNQFETGLSSGSLSAYKGGERDRWEHQLFGEAYVPSSLRPKYGALELISHADGPAPRFGSCYFILKESVIRRCSFTYDGSQSPGVLEHSGTIDTLEPVLAPLLARLFERNQVLGVQALSPIDFLERVLNDLSLARPHAQVLKHGRSLDNYIEAQIHGPILLERDVETLVADASFRASPIAAMLNKLAHTYHFDLQWHPGFEINPLVVPKDFRGPTVARLAQRLRPTGLLNVTHIGIAAMEYHRQPNLWRSWGSRDETLQHLKQLWHVLVAFGAPLNKGFSNPPQQSIPKVQDSLN